MKYLDEYRDADLSLQIAEKIKGLSTKPLNIMEVCGGHTMAIRKNGIQKLVGENINLISGPGCPVCVTSLEDIDKVISLAMSKNVVICTFGDLFYVPGSNGSLCDAKADGADVRIVYSVHDVLSFAKVETEKQFVFVSIGFETTTPSAAAAIIQARDEGIRNFFVLAYNKTMPNALRAVLSDEDSRINALICPGHVSAITGLDIYSFIVDELGVSCCVSGFEPTDILHSIYALTDLFENGDVKLLNAYKRAVRDEGNVKALRIMNEVFEPSDADWRGVGIIPDSGLKLKASFSNFDAENAFEIKYVKTVKVEGCICGDILKGAKKPSDCGLFKTICTPESPQGACMVSSEGSCAAWYKYDDPEIV